MFIKFVNLQKLLTEVYYIDGLVKIVQKLQF